MTDMRTPHPSPPNDRLADAGPAGSPAAGPSGSPGSRLANNPMLTFVPWVIFWVVAGPRDWELATGCALLASVVLLLLSVDAAPALARAAQRSVGIPGTTRGPALRLQTPKVLDLGTTGFFLALVIVGFFVDRQTLIVLEKYSQAISSAALGLIVVLSIAVGHPFTEQYARADTPPEVWNTPVFRRMMLVMSGIWAVIFGIMAILGLIAETGVSGSGSSDILNWYIPIALIVVGLKFNEWYPRQVERQLQPPSREQGTR